MAASNFTYKIPQDVAYDVLRSVIKNKVKYNIAGIREKENMMLLEIDINGSKYGARVKDGIETILTDYKHYMKDIVPDPLIGSGDDEDDNDE